MARTAEVVFVGDAQSLIRASQQAAAATEGATAKIEGSNAKVSASYLSMAGVTKKAADELEASHSRMASSLVGIGRSGTVATAAIVGLGAAIYGIKKSTDTLAEIAKETRTLHNVTGLAVETASAYAAVAQTQGLNARQLNQAFGTLAKNVQAVQNAHEGLTKSAKAQENAFKLLGLPLAEIYKAHGDMNKLLPQITKRFEEMPGGIQKAAVGMALFGRGWQTLVPLMHAGTLGMAEQLKVAKEMGAVLHGSSAKELAEFAKQQEQAKYASLGLQLAIGQYLAPALTKLIHTFADVAHALGGGIEWLKKHEGAAIALATVIAVTLGGALTVFAFSKAAQFGEALKGMALGLKSLTTSAGATATAVGTADGAMVAETEAAATAMKAALLTTGIGASLALLGFAAYELAEHWKDATTKIEEAGQSMANFLVDRLNEIIGNINEFTHAISFGLIPAIGKLGQLKGAGGAGGLGGAQVETPGGGKESLGQFGAASSAAGRSVVSLMHLGLSERAAQGVVKALQGETQKNLEVGAHEEGAEGAFGIAQWLGSRRAGLESFARSKHTPASNLETQLEYLAKELKGPERATLEALKRARSVKEASAIFIKLFERPEDASVVERRAAQYSPSHHAAAKAHRAKEEALSLSQITGWAEHSVGKFAESWGKNTGPELDKLQAEFHTHAAAWCAEFATTAAMMGGANKAVRTASVATIREWAQQGSHGYRKGVSHTPHVGDLMMFGDAHVGFVEAVHGSQVTTIEGNTSAGKVSVGHRSASEGDYASPIYSRLTTGAVLLSKAGKVYEEALKKAEHLLLSPRQLIAVGKNLISAAADHASVLHYGTRAEELGSNTEVNQARFHALIGRDGLSSAAGAHAAMGAAGEVVSSDNAEKRFYEHELKALQKEAKAWARLRDQYKSFARHVHGGAKAEALKKAAGYQAKVETAEKDAKALKGTIYAAETREIEAQTASAAVPGEVQAADLGAYQGALGKVDLEVRAGLKTEAEGKAAKEAIAKKALAGGYGELSPEGILQVTGDLVEFGKALESATNAVQAHDEALKEATKALVEFNRASERLAGLENSTIVKGLADVISGQIGGVAYHGRQMTAGAGSAARY